MEPTGVRETKILHRVTTGNLGKIKVWPSASREHLVPPIGTQPGEKNLKGGKGIKTCQSKKIELEA